LTRGEEFGIIVRLTVWGVGGRYGNVLKVGWKRRWGKRTLKTIQEEKERKEKIDS